MILERLLLTRLVSDGSTGDADVSGDDDPLHLGGAFSDIQEFLISVMAFDGIFLHQPVAAMDLNRLIDDAMVRLGADLSA